MKMVYVCSPYSADPEGNTIKARKYSRYVVDHGAIPLTPHIMLPQFMEEDTERELCMEMDMEFLHRCDELWVFGEQRTPGMVAEINKAIAEGKEIKYLVID